MRTTETAVVGMLVCAVAGAAFVAGRITADTIEAPPAHEEAPPAPRTKPRPETDRLDPLPAPPSPAEAAPPPPAGVQSASELLELRIPDAPKDRLDDADARARRLRADARAVADNAERTAAQRVADEIAKERVFLADKERGGTMNLLRELKSSGARAFDLVGSPERFGALFVRRAEGPAIDGTKADINEQLADGATITLPAGVWPWSVSSLGRGKPFPRDVLVTGAGMDATIVRLDEFNADTEIASLTFRDLTIDCSSNYMTDLRSDNPATLRLERCRVIGFDMAAGSSEMLSANGPAAFYATDCRIEAGFTRPAAIGSGNVFRVSGGFLGRLERCTFVGPFSSVLPSRPATTCDFIGCSFVNCKTNWYQVKLDAPPEGVRFQDCTVSELDAAAATSARIAFLSKVAAAWGRPAELFVLLAKYEMSLAPLVADRAAFAAFFESRAAGPTVDGASGSLTGPPPDAATVVFPAGSFEWRASRRLPAFNGDLVLAGQGADTTLVRLPERMNCRTLVLRDLTLSIDGGGITTSASRFLAIRIERCRIVGFDAGSGSSSVFDVSGPLAVFAEDSQFLAGYGRNPPQGNLFGTSDAVAARLERCTIRIPHGTICELRSGEGGFVFSGCRFADTDPRHKELFDKPQPGLTLVSCSVDYAAEKPQREKQRPLSEINGSWGDGKGR